MKSFLSLVKPQNREFAKSIKSLALGKFDSLHIAHQKLFDLLGENGAILCVQNPQSDFILPPKYRQSFASAPIFWLSLDLVKNKNDIEFVLFLKQILPSLQEVCIGYDFRFGRGRQYFPSDLERHFKSVKILSEVSKKKLSVHSGLLRELLKNGNIKQANRLLGRPYEIRGQIVRGQALGAQKLVATINLENDNFLCPEGVFAGFFQFCKSKDNETSENLIESSSEMEAILDLDFQPSGIEASLSIKNGGVNLDLILKKESEILNLQNSAQNPSGPLFPAAIFIGNRFSTDNNFSLEAHLLDCNVERKFAESMGFGRICLEKKIRENRRFTDLAQLKEQILRDISEVRSALHLCSLGDAN